MINKHEFKKISISEIKPYDRNARTHSTEQVKQIMDAIKEWGFTNPLLIDEQGNLIAGHGRLEAVKQLNKVDFKDEPILELPAIVVKGLSDSQKKALIIADNQIALNAGWDYEVLALELKELESVNYDLDLLAFDNVDELLSGVISESESESEIIKGEDDAYELKDKYDIKVNEGELWRLGEHYLICGDSTKPETLERLLKAHDATKADMVITDPPYNVDYQGGASEALKIKNDNMSQDDFIDFLTAIFKNIKNYTRAGGSFYIWHSSLKIYEFYTALKLGGLAMRQELIWVKNTITLSGSDYQWAHEPCLYGWVDGASHFWYSDRKQRTTLFFDKPLKSDLHPTMKPIELFAYQIGVSSKEGDIVLDTFGGSGTTIIACEQLGRRGAAVELDPFYCSAIIDRWQKLTGKMAELVE